MTTRQAPHEPESTAKTTRHPVWAPILEWPHPELLSTTAPSTSSAPTAFNAALQYMLQLGIPGERGAIGVKFPCAQQATLGEQPDGTWIGQCAPEQAAALRAVVEMTDLLEYPENFPSLLTTLGRAHWYGIEIRCREADLPPELSKITRPITAAGLHQALGIKPEALREENRQVIGSFPTIALDLTPLDQILAPNWRFLLGIHEVIALVVDANSNERTNLEEALASLIDLRAALGIDTDLTVGIAGEFTPEILNFATETRDGGSEILGTGLKQRLKEVLDLSTAFHHGKENVACAFAADVIFRAAQLTAAQHGIN